MKMQKHQRGMAALSMIMIIVVLLAVIGTVVATSRTSTTSTSGETNKLHASSIIDQGNTLRTGLQIMVAKAQTTLDAVTMDNNETTGLFGKNGGTVRQSPPIEAVDAGAQWFLIKGPDTNGLEVAQVSVGAKSSYAFVLSKVKQSVCEQINKQHFGFTTATTPTASGGSLPTITNQIGAGGLVVSAFGDAISGTNGATNAGGWNFGCVKIGSEYAYFNIVQP